jgi:hypothetical protein
MQSLTNRPFCWTSMITIGEQEAHSPLESTERKSPERRQFLQSAIVVLLGATFVRAVRSPWYPPELLDVFWARVDHVVVGLDGEPLNLSH